LSQAAREEWARAQRCLESATLLMKAGDPDSAVSRAYYSVFHGVSALFLLEGREHGKHEAVESAVHRDLVRPGRVPVAFGASYSRLRELRMVGDYGGSDHIKPADAEDALERARSMLDELGRLSRDAFR
jgi:uncharacterized protein